MMKNGVVYEKKEFQKRIVTLVDEKKGDPQKQRVTKNGGG